jgi:hypothetical protein
MMAEINNELNRGIRRCVMKDIRNTKFTEKLRLLDFTIGDCTHVLDGKSMQEICSIGIITSLYEAGEYAEEAGKPRDRLPLKSGGVS